MTLRRERGAHRAADWQGARALRAKRRSAKVVVVNIATGKTEREFVVAVKNPKSVHGHFRHARLTDAARCWWRT